MFIRRLFFGLALLAAGCSSLEGDDVQPADTPVEVTLDFVLGIDGGVDTRAARPLTSNDAWQRVQNVRVYVFCSPTGADGTYKYIKPTLAEPLSGTLPHLYIPGFEKTEVWRGEYDGEESRSARSGTYIFNSSRHYRFLAVGRDDISEGDESAALFSLSLTEDVTTLEEARLSLKAATCGAVQSEPFVGVSDDIVPAAAMKEPVSITLSRAVAGLLLYVENVPATAAGYDVKYVSVYNSTQMNTGITLLGRAPALSAPFATSSPQLLLRTEIPSTASVAEGVYVGTNSESVDHPNSLPPVGTWIIPQVEQSADGLHTMYVTLEDASMNERRRYWCQIEGGSFKHAFNANWFYGIGRHNSASNTDQPVDLRKALDGQYIIVYGSYQYEVDIKIGK